MHRETIARAICAADSTDWDILAGGYNGRQRQRDYLRAADAILPLIEADRAALVAQLAEAMEALRRIDRLYANFPVGRDDDDRADGVEFGLSLAADIARITLAKLETPNVD